MKQENPGESFERLTADIFRLLGFDVERDVLISGSQVDLLVKRTTGPFTDVYIVECKDHADTISVTTIRMFQSTLQSIKRTIPLANGIFVSKKPLTKEAKAFAESVGIQHVTLNELERKLVNLDNYATHLIEQFQVSDLYDHYIDLDSYQKGGHRMVTKGRARTGRKYIPRHISMASMDDAQMNELIYSLAARGKASEIETLLQDNKWFTKNKDLILRMLQSDNPISRQWDTYGDLFIKTRNRYPLMKLVEEWLDEDDSAGLIILGDYGTGKTSFIHRLAAKHAQEFLESTGETRCPIVIDLRDYPNGVLSHLLLADVAQKLNCGHLDWPLLYRYLSEGRLLMLLDGFDEMGFQIDARLRRVHFASILRLLEIPRNKVVITGRPSYFPSLSEYEEIITLLNLPSSALNKEKFLRTVSIAPFADSQIEKYVDSFASTLASGRLEEIKNVIEHVYNLRDLAERPFLLDLIIKTIPNCEAALTEITPGVLYEMYTTRWLDREYAKGEFRWLIGKAEKKGFMTALAWTMLQKGTLSVHFSDLSEWVRKHFDLSSPETVDYLAHDIRTCSFLKRDDQGNYAFIHRSFMEYFVAVKIVEEARKGTGVQELLKDTSLTGENANSVAFAVDILGESIFQVQGLVEKLLPSDTLLTSLRALIKLPNSVKRRLMSFMESKEGYKQYTNLDAILSSPFVLKLAVENKAKHKKGDKDKKSLDCNFCGRSQEVVKKLIAGPSVYICNICVLDILIRLHYISVNDIKDEKVEKNLELRCSFCGKSTREVKCVFSNVNAATIICNECHDICCEILEDDEKLVGKAS
jgi:hypothetical protein